MPGSGIRSTLTGFSERHGGRMVLAKWPDFAQHFDVLDEAFPQARFVHIIRDGRAVALSLRPKFERTLNRGRSSAPKAAQRDTGSRCSRGLTRPARSTYFEVRYEDFCEDVHGVIHAVLDHAGLDADVFPFQRCPVVLANRNGRHLSSASARELEVVGRIQGDVLSRHGYPPAVVAGQASEVAVEDGLVLSREDIPVAGGGGVTRGGLELAP